MNRTLLAISIAVLISLMLAAAHWTRRAPICELRPWAILYRAQPSRPKAACLTDNHHRSSRRCDRKSVSTPEEKVSGIRHVYEVRPHKDKRGVDLISDALPFGRLCFTGSRSNCCAFVPAWRVYVFWVYVVWKP